MERTEYELMNAVEDRMWWYHGVHANALAYFRLQRRRAARAQPATSAQDGASRPGPGLDAGCGTGGLLGKLAAAPDLASVVGLDYAQRAAELARAKSGRPVVVGTVNDLPFGDGTLSVIFSMDVLCHRAVDQEGALREAYRCLAPGGFLVMNLPAYQWLHSVHDLRVHNARRFSRPQAIAMLRAAGFTDVRASYWNTLLFPLMLLRRKLLPASDKSDVQLYPAPIEAIFRIILSLERAMIRCGLTLPFGGSIIVAATKP